MLSAAEIAAINNKPSPTYDTVPEKGFELEDLVRYPVAMTIDLMATMADSVTFGAFDIETEEVTGWVDDNLNTQLTDFYEQNQEIVQAGSFIAGTILPGMAALKMARAASTAYKGQLIPNYYKRIMDYQKISTKAAYSTLEKFGRSSSQYQQALKSMKWGNIGAAATEAAIFETGFSLMMNEHAYLEQNYGPEDFVLGVTIGSLAGPFKWMAEKNKLINYSQDLVSAATKESSLVAGANFITENRGVKLGAVAQIHQDSVKYSFDAASDLHEGLIKQREIVGQDIKHIIESMMPDTLKTGNRIENAKNVKVVTEDGTTELLSKYVSSRLTYPGQHVYDVSPTQLTMGMVAKHPKVFAGVDSFDSFQIGLNNPVYGKGIAKSMVDQVQGEVRAINSKNIAKGFGIPLSEVEVPRPSWVKVKTESINGRMHNVIEVPTSKAITKDEEFKEWFGSYANGEESLYPTVVRSLDNHLNGFSYQPLLAAGRDFEGNVMLMQRSNPSIGVDEALRVLTSPLEEEHTFGVITRQFGEKIIPSTHAMFMLPAAGDPSVVRGINRGAKVGNLYGMKYEPLLNRTQDSDGRWVETLYALRNSGQKGLEDFVVKDTKNLYQLQAVYLDAIKYLGTEAAKKGPRLYKIDLGEGLVDIGTDNIDEIKSILMESKVDWIKELTKKGIADEQISLHVNLDVETIRSIRAGSFSMDLVDMLNPKATIYNFNHDPTNILNAAPIAVFGKNRSYAMMQEATETIVLDRHFRRDIMHAIIREHINKLGGTDSTLHGFVQELYDELAGSPMAVDLVEGLSKATANVKTINTRFTDTAQQLRHLGRYADNVVTWNAALTNIMTRRFDDIHESVDLAHKAIAQNPAATMQFEHVRRLVQKNKNEVLELVEDKILLRNASEKAGKPVYAQYVEGGEITLLPEARAFIEKLTKETRELYNFMNFTRQLDGLPPLPDKGIWFPYEAVEDKFIAFKISKNNFDDMEILTATTEAQYKALIAQAKADPKIVEAYDIVDRAQVNRWNDLMDLAAVKDLVPSDPGKLKKAIATFQPRPDTSGIDSILDQVQRHYWHLTRHFIKQSNPELFAGLRGATEVAESPIRSAKGTIQQHVGRSAPASQIVESALLNYSLQNRKYTPLFSRVNDAVQAKINHVLYTGDQLFEGLKQGSGYTTEGFVKLDKQLKAAGIPNPYQSFEDFLLAKKASKTIDMAQHRVAQMGSFVTMLNLRLLDASHAILTALSTPVVMSGLMQEYQFPMKEYYKTAKWLMKGGPEVDRIMEKARKLGYVKRVVSEFSQVTRDLHVKPGKQVINKMNNLANKLSWASDTSEEVTREFAYAMAYRMGKTKGITDPSLLRSYAHTFVVRSMGNYNSRQRPTIFQGTLGGMIGLYQTFMLSMAQNIYRYVERADLKALGALAGAQASMFGFESLPFYNEVNRYLGAYVLSDDMDVTSEVYNLFGGQDESHSRSAAEFILFGAPSALFQSAFFTRGELQPRTPLYFEEGLKFTPAIMDNVMRIGEFGANLTSSVTSSLVNNGITGDMGRAFGQALALQYVWRPGARVSEAIMGRTYDGKGEVINTHEFFTLPTITRLLSSRPLAEEVIKRTRFNGSFYNQIDRGKRQKVIKEVRRLVATDGLTEDGMASLNEKYLDNGGSPQGWIDAMKKAMTEADTPTAQRLMEHFKKNEAYVEIFEGY